MNLCDLNVVCVVVRGVGPDQHPVHSVIRSSRAANRPPVVSYHLTSAHLVVLGKREWCVRFLVRKPLSGERGPVEGVSDDQVIQEGRVALPNLVLLDVTDHTNEWSALGLGGWSLSVSLAYLVDRLVDLPSSSTRVSQPLSAAGRALISSLLTTEVSSEADMASESVDCGRVEHTLGWAGLWFGASRRVQRPIAIWPRSPPNPTQAHPPALSSDPLRSPTRF